jgi:aminobenzoyl-glutamate utilization protein A
MNRLNQIVDQIEDKVIAYRRDFHRHAEPGWTEYRTASLVARRLHELGYQLQVGRDVLADGERMGLPPAGVLEECWQRAGRQGGDPEFLEAVRGGFPAVVATLVCGEGPTVGLRFEMDALELEESQSPDHRPQQQGFASVNPEAMHACAHDAHTAIGLGVAEVLATLKDRIHGRVVLLFQPAEEGVRGARTMVGAGVVDDVTALLGLHLYSGWEFGQLDPGRSGFLATSKFDAYMTGAPAHAGGKPHLGRNALLAAATAVLNLHAIPRHGDGATRVNVGRLTAGSGRNVIPAEAHLAIETRGATTELNRYMADAARRVLEAAAAMHGCQLELRPMGEAGSAQSDAALSERVWAIAQELGGFTRRPPDSSRGSEDYTIMMERVQSRGGLATNIGLGAGTHAGGHHTAGFDIDERAIRLAVQLLAATSLHIMAGAER